MQVYLCATHRYLCSYIAWVLVTCILLYDKSTSKTKTIQDTTLCVVQALLVSCCDTTTPIYGCVINLQ